MRHSHAALKPGGVLHAMVTTDLTARELDDHDPNDQVTIGVRASKAG